jgi:hypothetical protein
MRHLFDTKYMKANGSTLVSSININNKNSTRSKLDEDFDDEEEEDLDELECYIAEKPANKEVDVLVWWKVSAIYCL